MRFLPLLFLLACGKSKALDARFLTPHVYPAAMPFAGVKAKVEKKLEGHSEEPSALAFSADGRFLYSASYGDYTIRKWDVASGAEVASTKSKNRVNGLFATQSSIITTDVYQCVTYFTTDLARTNSVEVKSGNWTRAALSPNGMILAVSSFDKKIFLINAADGTLLQTIEKTDTPRGVALSNTHLAVGHHDNTFCVYDLSTGAEENYLVPKADAKSDVYSIAFNRDGSLIATAHMDSSVTAWQRSPQKNIINSFIRSASAHAVAFSPDGSIFVTGQQDSRIYMWDLKTGQQLGGFSGHSDAVVSLAFSPDGTTLATGSKDKTILIWK